MTYLLNIEFNILMKELDTLVNQDAEAKYSNHQHTNIPLPLVHSTLKELHTDTFEHRIQGLMFF